ncbi:Formin Homology 2 domain protein [Theileria parva strain Muguga]|uniref:Formin Homology 2 domain protein n=1 Tax=Theileria parva strain Muguga TaxID=333668 RepID=UPI001C61B9F9|nr:Formin Homology 2 domain protein [Theileria parva strain Muguga]KAF5153257.1 Formin Homology 2 domain protein [Theileria parva strain Muguga]
MEYVDNDGFSNGKLHNVHKLNVASRLSELPMNKGSNISPQALGMSVKMDLVKRRSTQTASEKEFMYSGGFTKTKNSRVSDEILSAADILNKINSTTASGYSLSNNSLVYREALATRMLLRTMALKNFANNNYSDALLEAHYSLLLSKKFHSQVRKTPLCGEMAIELMILSKCYARIGHFKKGKEHLAEFRFLVENTLLQYSKGSQALSDDSKNAVIDCDKKVFLPIVYILAEVLSSYGMSEDAEIFFSKYLALYVQLYGEFDLGLSNALGNVCIYMIRDKQYMKALPLCIKNLEILKKHFGDYDSEQPNIKVAEAYNNLGIVYRLLNNPIDALQQFFKAIDMKMRLCRDRNHPSVQDILLSIGCCFHILGQFTSCASIYREVYTTRSDSLGKSHPSTIAVHQLLTDLERDINFRYNESDKSEQPGDGLDKSPKSDSKIKRETELVVLNSPTVDVSRIVALYSNKMESIDLNKSKVNSCSEVIFPTERLLDLSKKLNLKLMKLPVINVPKLSKGTLFIKDGLPAMTLNPDAEDILRDWGVDPPDVSISGEVLNSDLRDDGVRLFVPLVKEDNELILGYHDKPVFVPNPAIFHSSKQVSKMLESSSPTRTSLVSKITRVSNDPFMKPEPPERREMATSPKSDSAEKPDTDPDKSDSDKVDTEKPEELVKEPEKLSVRHKIGEFERLKSVKFIEKPKVVEEPIVSVPITELVKSKNSKNAKFLAKIGSLSNIKVKQNMSPKIDNSVLKKTMMAKKIAGKIARKVPTKRLAQSPKHKRAFSNSSDDSQFSQDSLIFTDETLYSDDSFILSDESIKTTDYSDDDTVIESCSVVSNSDTPVNSDYELINDYSITNELFTSPAVYSLPDTVSPANLMKQDVNKLPLLIRYYDDVIPVEIARRVASVKTYFSKVFNDFLDEDNKDKVESKEDKTENTTEDQKNHDKPAITPKNNTSPGDKTPVKSPKGTNNSDDMTPETSKNPPKSNTPNVDKTYCMLLDCEGNELASVPWTVDLVSLSIARSCLQEDFLNRYSFLAKANKAYLKKKELSFKVETDEERKKNELLLCRMLLAGQGLTELGFAKIATSMQAITNDLTAGLDFKVPNSVLESIKKQQEQIEKEMKELELAQKKKEEELKKKEAAAKKAPPPAGKKAPPGPGKKGPPLLKGKGPLPPPSKGGFGKAAKKAAPGKPVVDSNLRRFFWDPIFGDDAKDTIFSTQKLRPIVEVAQIEQSFAKATPKAKDKAVEKAKPKFIQLLPDSKRSYNMNIGLSKFSKYTFNEIREAIIHLDPNVLNVDSTESILLLLPNTEEISVVSEFVKSGGDLSAVDKPEQFVASLIGIPLMRQRLECHQIALTFRDNYNDIYYPLENIMDSCECIMDSVKLNILVHFILNVGNKLNEGDPSKGNAEGFKPTTFPKLNDFRTTTKPSKTLLQYICDMIADEDENILDVLDDLKSLDSGSKVDIDALKDKMKRFTNDLDKIKNSIKNAQNVKCDFQDNFTSIMREFLVDAEPKVNSLSKHFEEVMTTFKEVARFTGYTEKEVDKVKPSELFKYLWSFALSVDQYRKQRIEARIKLEKKAIAQTKVEVKKTPKLQQKQTKLVSVPKLQNDDLVNIVKTI